MTTTNRHSNPSLIGDSGGDGGDGDSGGGGGDGDGDGAGDGAGDRRHCHALHLSPISNKFPLHHNDVDESSDCGVDGGSGGGGDSGGVDGGEYPIWRYSPSQCR